MQLNLEWAHQQIRHGTATTVQTNAAAAAADGSTEDCDVSAHQVDCRTSTGVAHQQGIKSM